jgi:hypothetical protein
MTTYWELQQFECKRHTSFDYSGRNRGHSTKCAPTNAFKVATSQFTLHDKGAKVNLRDVTKTANISFTDL